MLYTNVVTVGNKVNFSKNTGLGSEQQAAKQYVSQVLDLVDDDRAIVAMPMENGRVIPLSVGEKYLGFFYTGKGMYQCNCEIIDRYKDGNMYVMLIQFVSAFEKYQRRQYFRLDMLKNVQFRIISPQEKIISQKIEEDKFDNEVIKAKFINTLTALQATWHEGIATDLSGGGMRFNAKVDRSESKELIMKLEFEVGKKELEYELLSEIIEVSMMMNKPGFDEYRIRFMDITKEERENIIKYIFEEERKRRKKENT